MTFWTTGLAVVAGLCFAFSFLEAFFGWKRKTQRTVHLEFAVFALMYGASVLASRAGYAAMSAEDFVAAERMTAIFAPMAWIGLLWFVADFTELQQRKVLGVLSALFAAITIVGVVAPNLIVGDAAGVSTFEFAWGEQVLVQRGEDAPLTAFAILMQLAGLVFIIAATVRQYRRGARTRARILAIGIGWFMATVATDLLVDIGAVDFVYLSDFGFLGFVIAVSIQLARNTVETEQDLLLYQANLVAMVDERTNELRRTQAQVVRQAAERAAVDERGRVARELHDVLTQTLFSVNLIASSLPRLWQDDPEQAERNTHELRRLTRAAMAEMRTMLRELRPDTIVETRLDTLIEQLVDGLATRHDLQTDVRTEMSGVLPTEVHIAVYRITQEALNNIAKHANANKLSVALDGDSRRVKLEIGDDGLGFDPRDLRDGSMGLGIMRERAGAVGARLTIDTAPGSGTRVRLDWYAPDDENVGP